MSPACSNGSAVDCGLSIYRAVGWRLLDSSLKWCSRHVGSTH